MISSEIFERDRAGVTRTVGVMKSETMKIDDFHCKGCNGWFDVFKKGAKKGFCMTCKPRPLGQQKRK